MYIFINKSIIHSSYILYIFYIYLCIITGERRDAYLVRNGIIVKRIKTNDLYALIYNEQNSFIEKILDLYLL